MRTYPRHIAFVHDPNSKDPWNAYHAAGEYCRAQGWSVGSMQRGAPTAIFEDESEVSKWRNLSAAERKAALATLEPRGGPGSFRDCDVVLAIRSSPKRAEVAA